MQKVVHPKVYSAMCISNYTTREWVETPTKHTHQASTSIRFKYVRIDMCDLAHRCIEVTSNKTQVKIQKEKCCNVTEEDGA